MENISINTLVQTLTPYVIQITEKLIASLIVLIVGFKLTKYFVKWIKGSKAFSRMNQNVSSFFGSFLSIAIKAVIIITVAGILGIPMASFITVLGSMAVAIGLSLQGSLANIAGGLIILLCKPFVIGDYIVADGKEGHVTEIGLYYTHLKTIDNQDIVVPNAVVSNQTLTNVTHQLTRRIDLNIAVGYHNDIDTIKDILLGIAAAHPKVLTTPAEPMARLAEHGANALVFTFRCWCNTEDYWDVRFDLLESVKNSFDKLEISIPYPQLDVHLDKS